LLRATETGISSGRVGLFGPSATLSYPIPSYNYEKITVTVSAKLNKYTRAPGLRPSGSNAERLPRPFPSFGSLTQPTAISREESQELNAGSTLFAGRASVARFVLTLNKSGPQLITVKDLKFAGFLHEIFQCWLVRVISIPKNQVNWMFHSYYFILYAVTKKSEET